MDNHYHLLLETPDANLSRVMRDVNGHYTQWFNARHQRVGHVLQGRYKACVVEKELYLLELVRYIVNNPVVAGMVAHPKDWKWSSYKATVGTVETPVWLDTALTLKHFSAMRTEAIARFRRFVRERSAQDSPYDVGENVTRIE